MADNCGYWKYLGDSEPPKQPRILTRAEKGQALTHLEMDTNLASLVHTIETSSAGSEFSSSESSQEVDIFFERKKPTRAEEMEGLFATFSYAPIKQGEGEEEVIELQYPPVMVKVQHTTDEIRYKLSNEQIPGTLDIAEDFHVTGSSYVAQDASVSGSIRVKQDVSSDTLHVSRSATIGKDLRMAGTASIDGDVYIKGNLYVNGVMFGNLSRPEYNTPNYASAQPATISTGEGVEVKEFYTKAEVDQLLAALRSELLAEIHGQTQK